MTKTWQDRLKRHLREAQERENLLLKEKLQGVKYIIIDDSPPTNDDVRDVIRVMCSARARRIW
jgi:hypothetical protein